MRFRSKIMMNSKNRPYFCFLLLVFLSMYSDVAFGQLHEPYVVSSTVSDCVNVRPAPDASTGPLACLPAGTAVTVVGTVPFWREITFGANQRGWVAKKYLQPASVPGVSTAETIPSNAILAVHFIDVGQGDAILIQTHDDGIDGNGRFEGYNIVIDGGPSSADNNNPLLSYIEGQGHHWAEIEALIVTHPHTDHFRGAETISRHFDIEHYYDPGFPSNLVSYNRFIEAMRGTNGQSPRAHHIHLRLENFGTLDWGSELDVEVLYSWIENSTGLGSGNTLVNNSSIVLRLEYGDHVFLFTGDAEGKDRDNDPNTARYVEAKLLEAHQNRLSATVLKVGHHGSETSSTIPFIQAVNPNAVVVQSGRKSFRGTFLPDSTTLQRYCYHNPSIRIYRTDQNDEEDSLSENESADGDNIVIRTNGRGQPEVQAFEGGDPFQVDSCQP